MRGSHMSQRHTMLRSMHDLGLGAWFGGSLMGAIGVNGATRQIDNPQQRLPVASAGWAQWTPINAAAIGTHLVGAAGEMVTESGRVMTQKGVGRMSTMKTALTAAALAVTGYSRMLGKKIEKAGTTPVAGTTAPSDETPSDVAATQQKLKFMQWTIPALTGALIVITAYAGEQEKPGEVMRGMMGRAMGFARAPMRAAGMYQRMRRR
ncbi:MAG TPA: hypothetical protein VFX60_15575, partial [Micromonospora sp.]|nr:hypothetical protein [Micromonospora sp.]